MREVQIVAGRRFCCSSHWWPAGRERRMPHPFRRDAGSAVAPGRLCSSDASCQFAGNAPGCRRSENTAHERQLDDPERSTAAAHGAVIEGLRIPLGAILSSPTYGRWKRCGSRPSVRQKPMLGLGDGGHSMLASAVADQAGWLPPTVLRAPSRTESNTIIVTHMPKRGCLWRGGKRSGGRGNPGVPARRQWAVRTGRQN